MLSLQSVKQKCTWSKVLYTEALTKLKAYKKANPADPEIDKRIDGCELALKCGDKKTRYIIESFQTCEQKQG